MSHIEKFTVLKLLKVLDVFSIFHTTYLKSKSAQKSDKQLERWSDGEIGLKNTAKQGFEGEISNINGYASDQSEYASDQSEYVSDQSEYDFIYR